MTRYRDAWLRTLLIPALGANEIGMPCRFFPVSSPTRAYAHSQLIDGCPPTQIAEATGWPRLIRPTDPTKADRPMMPLKRFANQRLTGVAKAACERHPHFLLNAQRQVCQHTSQHSVCLQSQSVHVRMPTLIGGGAHQSTFSTDSGGHRV
jgi:hypothetical protein